jgi:hypothetical protein
MDIKSQKERMLVDWVWISGALIFLALICLCVVLLARGANQLETTPAHGIPLVAGSPPITESNPEAHTQAVTAVTPPDSQYRGFVSQFTQPSSDIPSDPKKATQSPSVTDKLAATNPRSTKSVRGNQRNLAAKPLASRRRSAIDKGVPRTVKMLIKMWRRTLRTTKLAQNESHQGVERPRN